MKTFRNLKFEAHTRGKGLSAQMNFTNGYGISVVRFRLDGLSVFDRLMCRLFNDSNIYGSYTKNEEEWEIAVFKNERFLSGHGLFGKKKNEDVLGYLSSRQVTEWMKKIQMLPKEKL